MSISEYAESHAFRLFCDERLRQHACQSVELFLEKHTAVKKSQLHPIPSVIQAKGLSGLESLTDNQKTKNTKQENKEFWEFIHNLIVANPGPDFSLRTFLKKEPEISQLFEDETKSEVKTEQKSIKKANKKILDTIINQILSTYFEHFNCHYFYKVNLSKVGQGVMS